MESRLQCGGATSNVDTAWSTPARVWTDVPPHADGLPQGSMCRDVTLQPYNMAKQQQPPPGDYRGPVGDFLLILIELFSLGFTAEAL